MYWKTAIGRKRYRRGQHLSFDFDRVTARADAEVSEDNFGSGGAMLIAREEELIDHSYVRRDEKIARKRDSVEHLVIGRNIGVEDTEVTDDLAAYIREHRKLNLVSLAKGAQYLARIVSYTRGVDSLAFELGERLLQRDGRVTAVGALFCPATEYQHRPI